MLQGQKMLHKIKSFQFFIFILVFSSCVPSNYSDKESSEVSFKDNSVSSASTRGPSSQGGSVYTDPGSVNLVLANRYVVASTLSQVFNIPVEHVSIRDIYEAQDIFGGSCVQQDTNLYLVGNRRYLEGYEQRCFSRNYNTDESLSSTAVRQGWMIRTCERLINHYNYSSRALNQVGIQQRDSLNYEKLNKLYQMFYPLENIPKETYSTIESYQSSLTADELWKASLLTFCISPGWQII